ncbi:MAG: dihydroxyacetone kinase subunit L [Lachnospiraceae bacterium]|nr:dihydroxyacetone kinase subunit L [Lachnospiraceae bacterium]
MTDSAKVLEILGMMKAAIDENAQYLTELDAAIGDNDHGINMARGFRKIEEDLPGLAGRDIGAILKKAGMDLVSTVGGSSGPLYGTAFMKAGARAAGKETITLDDFLAMMEEAVEGVKMRGKAVRGEKTMLDSMIPALDAMKSAASSGEDAATVLSAGVAAAEDGVEYTKTIIATKGRASYLGERSIGHQDPGATSFAVLLKAIARAYGG